MTSVKGTWQGISEKLVLANLLGPAVIQAVAVLSRLWTPKKQTCVVCALYALMVGTWVWFSEGLSSWLPEGSAWFFSDYRYRGMVNVCASTVVLGLLVYLSSSHLARWRTTVEARQRQIEDLFQLHTQPMWVYDRQTLEFLHVNPAAVRFFGYSTKEFRAMQLTDVRPSEDAAAERALNEQTFSRRRELGIARQLKKSGELAYMRLTALALSYQDRDAVMVMAVDRTQDVLAARSGQPLGVFAQA